MEGRIPISVKVSTYEKLDNLRHDKNFTFDEAIVWLIDKDG